MAAAEARAAWQRTANRCFVQEDAKRAPKLACCSSASASSKLVDAGPASAADGHNNLISGFVPLNRNSSYSNLTPDSRWWLQLQPTYGYQRGLVNEQSNPLEAEMETFSSGVASSTPKHSGAHLENEDDGDMNFETCVKEDVGTRKQELKGICSKNAQEPLKNTEDLYELLEMNVDGGSVSKETSDLCFDLESPWIGVEKNEPWWRTADRDELALLVAQRSLDPIENCDLPRPQNLHFKRDPCDLSNLTVHTRGNLTSGSTCAKHLGSVERDPQHGSNTKTGNIDNTSPKVMHETKFPNLDPSKAELLEALRHSQTRAREAEKAANQAYAEKEHIVKLFFKQASHLFAYKQWFKLLQLENLYFQITSSNKQISTLFPVVLPWMPHKTRKLRKKWQKTGSGIRGRRGRPRCNFGKFAVAFALGFSLVSAGLLLGWTVGWMLPTF